MIWVRVRQQNMGQLSAQGTDVFDKSSGLSLRKRCIDEYCLGFTHDEYVIRKQVEFTAPNHLKRKRGRRGSVRAAFYRSRQRNTCGHATLERET